MYALEGNQPTALIIISETSYTAIGYPAPTPARSPAQNHRGASVCRTLYRDWLPSSLPLCCSPEMVLYSQLLSSVSQCTDKPYLIWIGSGLLDASDNAER